MKSTSGSHSPDATHILAASQLFTCQRATPARGDTACLLARLIPTASARENAARRVSSPARQAFEFITIPRQVKGIFVKISLSLPCQDYVCICTAKNSPKGLSLPALAIPATRATQPLSLRVAHCSGRPGARQETNSPPQKFFYPWLAPPGSPASPENRPPRRLAPTGRVAGPACLG